MRVNIGLRWAAAALGLGLLPGACSPPPSPPSPLHRGFLRRSITRGAHSKTPSVCWSGNPAARDGRPSEAILRDLGVRYEVQRYAAGPGEGANLFFDLGGGAKTLIVSAQHDAVPGNPGANDDASCVSAILNAYTKIRRTPPANLKVRFIFFDGEESGLKGSKEYVRTHDLKNVLAMFSLELCGIGDAAAVWESEETERKTPASGHSLKPSKKTTSPTSSKETSRNSARTTSPSGRREFPRWPYPSPRKRKNRFCGNSFSIRARPSGPTAGSGPPSFGITTRRTTRPADCARTRWP